MKCAADARVKAAGRKSVRLNGDDGQWLVIERAEFHAPATSGDDDLLLNISVSVGGYSAADQCWVPSIEWAEFLSQLRELESLRRGRATLRGASSDDLEVTFAAIDRVGHRSVSGFIGWRRPDGVLQKLEFGFRFDPGILATLVRDLDTFER